MSKFGELFDKLKSSVNYVENTQILAIVLNSVNRGKKPVENESLNEIKSFVVGELSRLSTEIVKASNYKTKDEMFEYHDKIMELFSILVNKKQSFSDGEITLARSVVNIIEKEQVLEFNVNKMFDFDKIEKIDVMNVLDIIRPIKEEFHKGLLYVGLLYHKDCIKIKFSKEAKEEMSKYIADELENYLQKKDSLNADEINSLEIACDVSNHFISDVIIALLKEVMQLKLNNVRFYALEPLLSNRQNIDKDVIAELANDLIYADSTYSLLRRYNQEQLFPKELSEPEYLAKSDMVQWLNYPTELGKVPDMIELIGTVKVKKDMYYVFKYKSNSDTISDDIKNKWLIGWASNEGGTFSNFDLLSLFEQSTTEKTLKIIKKKLLG